MRVSVDGWKDRYTSTAGTNIEREEASCQSGKSKLGKSVPGGSGGGAFRQGWQVPGCTRRDSALVGSISLGKMAGSILRSIFRASSE